MKTLRIILIIIILPISAIYSQPRINDATRETDKSIRKKIEEKLKPALPEVKEIIKEEEKKEELDSVKFFVKKINLSGYESISLTELKFFTEKYENRKVSLKELNKLTKEIKTTYLKKGIIAACIIPPQPIKNQTVTLIIIEAKLGNVVISEHKYFSRKRILYYWNINPGDILQYDKMSQSLQLMNQNPDRNVRATLHAGKIPKTTDILLDIDTRFPLHLSSSFDNEGTIFTGKKRSSLGMRHNNLLGLDDSLLIGQISGNDFSGLYAYHLLPVNSLGTSILYGYSYSKSFPKKEFEIFHIDSRSKNYSIFLRHDIFNKATYWGQVHLGLDANDKITRGAGSTISRDRLRVLKTGFSTTKNNIGSLLYIESEFSQGINLLGAQRKTSATSRFAPNTFSKLNALLNYKKSLPLNSQANINIQSQLAFSKLTPQEEFSLGGIDSVRGYPSGDYLADTGILGNIEILLPAFFIPANIKIPFEKTPFNRKLTGLLFIDYGYGRKRFAGSNEKKTANLLSAGAGLRINLFSKVIMKLEWGFPLGDDTITEQGNSHFHFSIDFET